MALRWEEQKEHGQQWSDEGWAPNRLQRSWIWLVWVCRCAAGNTTLIVTRCHWRCTFVLLDLNVLRLSFGLVVLLLPFALPLSHVSLFSLLLLSTSGCLF